MGYNRIKGGSVEKILKWCSVTLAGILLAIGVASTLFVPVMATEDTVIQPRNGSDAASGARGTEGAKEIPSTFITELDEADENVRLWVGKNLFIAGNNIKTSTSADRGLMFVAGNTLELSSEAEYVFLAGNIVNYSGETSRDLFIAGNYVTLRKEALIGRDAYVASDTLIVETDLAGDLSATAGTVELRDITIDGNVNLTADNIKFTGNVKIAGALVYNETATVSGIEHVSYDSVEVYEVPEVSPFAQLIVEIYSKIASVAALFIIMALICAIYPKMHNKIADEADVNRFGIDIALGFGALLLIPIIALVAFMSFIAAPLGIIALALYVVIVYLAQGFAGVWLGHLVIEKGFKSKGNIFAEAFIGILILGVLSLIPYLGVITGFLGLLLGLGLILQCIKPTKDVTPKVSAKFETESKEPKKQSKPKAEK